MRALFAKLIDDEAGVTAVEYGLIAALIAVPQSHNDNSRHQSQHHPQQGGC
jgi:hypothetical protein